MPDPHRNATPPIILIFSEILFQIGKSKKDVFRNVNYYNSILNIYIAFCFEGLLNVFTGILWNIIRNDFVAMGHFTHNFYLTVYYVTRTDKITRFLTNLIMNYDPKQ